MARKKSAKKKTPARRAPSPKVDDVLEHPLMPIFYAAVEQAMKGKGSERHGTTEDFLQQPIFWIGHATGPRGPLYQVMKKAHEAVYCYEKGTFDHEAAVKELLGALVYLASIVILINSDGVGMEHFTRDEDYIQTDAIGFKLEPVYDEEDEEGEE